VSEKETIVLVGPAYPLRGGIAHFNESLARELTNAGFEVKIVSFYLQYPSILFPGKTQYALDDPPRDLEIHSLISSVNPLSWVKTAKTILSWNPSVAIFRFWLPFMGPALGAIAKRLRRKGCAVVGLVDNAIPHEKRMGDLLLSKRFFSQCDGFFTLSQSVSDDLDTIVPSAPKAVSPHPIYDFFGDIVSREEALKSLGLAPQFRYILFFGFIRKYKGLDLLINGFAKSELKSDNVKLLVAGEFYEDEKLYLDLIDQLGLKDEVILRNDYIPEEEVRNYFCAASLVAQTYRSATQSGVTQIAYHFERPMLVTNVGGLPEIVSDGKVGFVVEKDEDAIASGLRRFFDEDLEPTFVVNVQKEKRRFSWTHFCSELVIFVERVKHKKAHD
jgi:glycosyltransferase involved in cell wall biosynthesis